MLEIADIKPGELVYDLGAGDGRIVIAAVKEFGAESIGVELREDLAKKALEEIKNLNLEGKARIVHGNFFDVDVSAADVVTLYLNTSANERLKPKLEKELRNGARIVSHDFEINGWKAGKIIHDLPGHTLYLYTLYR